MRPIPQHLADTCKQGEHGGCQKAWDEDDYPGSHKPNEVKPYST